MYVDESYNPQGDGGGLTFSVQINVYGQAGDKYVPLTTQEILEDNELQEETTSMFNYASNGMYISGVGTSGPEYATDESQKTTGLYSMEDEDGVSYYYRGNVTNNNVQFGEYTEDYYVYDDGVAYFQSLESCTEANGDDSQWCSRVKLASAGDKMYWKIVRVNGDGSLRLIYNGTSATPDFSDLAHLYAIGQVPYNLESNEPKYAAYTYDRDTNETDSFIKREVDTWYEKALGDTVYDGMVSSGRFCSDSSGYKLETDYGFPDVGDYTVFASYDRLVQSATGYTKSNEPSLMCPDTDETYGGSYRLKAGLITADELVLAGENPGVITDGYLSANTSRVYYWSMTPTDFGYGNARVWYELDYLTAYNVRNLNAVVRPVINVTTDNGFTSGDGTAENPYIITE